MASDTSNPVMHIRRLVRSSIRLAYHCACDHPEVLAAAILLLLLHGLCPTLFAFMLSSSPVIGLTAFLLGALLSYSEGTVPVDGEETLKENEKLPLKSNIYVSDCLIKEAENFAVRAQLEKRPENESGEVYVRERGSDDCTSDAPWEVKNVAYIASDAAVLSGEAYAEEDRTPDDNLHGTQCEEKNVTFVAADTVPSAEPCNNTGEIDEKAELQEHGSTCTGSCNSGAHSQYQFGEFMRSCWQPIIRQDLPCSGSESDLTYESSSPDASMTDIIPMLEDLHPLINMGTGQLSLSSKDNMDSSSEDNEDGLEEEEDDISSDDDEGAELQQDGQNIWKDVVHINCFDMEQNGKLENLMELQRAKNILKFELDMRSIDLQASDATRTLGDASSFHVQVPSISTARHNLFDPEISRIPGSAPSDLLPRRNMFDLRFDRVMDRRSRFEETWSPRSRFGSAQNIKHRNSYGQKHSTCLQHHNDEVGESHSDNNDAEREGDNRLFGSLEAHLGEEMKILSAAISDVGMLGEVDHGTEEGTKTTNVRDDTSSLSGVGNPEPHFVEADSMSEVNSLFKCRMEEVLVQSISERSVCQPLELKPEDIPSVSLSSDLHVNGASSDEDLNIQFGRLDEEARGYAAYVFNGHGDSIRDRSSEALLVVDKQGSELPIGLDGCWELSSADMSEPNKPATAYTDLPVLEASSVEEMNPLFEQLEESMQLSNGRSKINIPQHRLRELEMDAVELNSRSRVIDAETMDGASDSGLNATEPNKSAEHAEVTAVAGQATEDE